MMSGKLRDMLLVAQSGEWKYLLVIAVIQMRTT